MDLIKEVTLLLEEAKQEIASNMTSKKINASGRTMRALKVVVRGNNIMLIKEDGDNAPIETTEKGRGPGKVPKGINEKMLQWMDDKGIQAKLIPYKTDRPHKYTEEERSKRLAAGAITHKIIKEGTSRHASPRNDIYSNVIALFKKKLAARMPYIVAESIREKQKK